MKHLDALVPIQTNDGPAMIKVTWHHEESAEGRTPVNLKLSVRREHRENTGDVRVLIVLSAQKGEMALLRTERVWKIVL